MFEKTKINEKEAGVGPFFKKEETFKLKQMEFNGQCLCGSVGRAVASDNRGLWFESSHRQKFILNICVLSIVY